MAVTVVREFDTETENIDTGLLHFTEAKKVEEYANTRLSVRPDLKFLFYKCEIVDELIPDVNYRIGGKHGLDASFQLEKD